MKQPDVGFLFRKVIDNVMVLMADAYRHAEVLNDSHPLSQIGLIDGDLIVLDYMKHNENKVALEHLLYMISEPSLSISPCAEECLAQLCSIYGVSRTSK